MENQENPNEVTDSLNKIQGIIQVVGAMGANEYEIGHLNSIKKEVSDEKKDPQTGLKEAQQILDSKQDYH